MAEKKTKSVAAGFFTGPSLREQEPHVLSSFQQVDEGRKIIDLPIDELHPFDGHVFSVRDDEEMTELARSVAEYGVRQPIQARPRPEGGYEIIAGHRRVEASKRAGMITVPVIVEDIDDDTAAIIMVDTNLGQRQHLLPSEKAFAYKVKLDAMRRQGARTDITSPKVSAKFRSDDALGEKSGESGDTIRLFIRLTELTPQLLEAVDSGTLKFTPAVKLSYLKPEEQKDVWEFMEREQTAPSLDQANQLKDASEKGELNLTVLKMCMDKSRADSGKANIKMEKLDAYWQRKTPKEAEKEIISLANTAARLRQYTTLFPENITTEEFERRLVKIIKDANENRMRSKKGFDMLK